jgi:Homing endonuclease associated repeat
MRNQKGRNLSQKEILEEIKRVAKQIGNKRITVKVFNQISTFNASTVRSKFGSWDNALRQAGITLYSEDNLEKTKIKYLGLLKTATKKLGVDSPSLADYDKLKLGTSSQVIRKFFGSWTNALKQANLSTKRSWKYPYTKKECFENLLKVWSAIRR